MMSNMNINVSQDSDLRNTKQEEALRSLDPDILLGLSYIASGQSKVSTPLSLSKIRTKLSSIEKDINDGHRREYDNEILKGRFSKQSACIVKRPVPVEKYQATTAETDKSLPESNYRFLHLSCVKMENGFYSAVSEKKMLNHQTKPEVSNASEVRTAEGIKTSRRFPQHLLYKMQYTTPEFKPYVPRLQKQFTVSRKRQNDKTMRSKSSSSVPRLRKE